ncbi:2-oxoglutaramate amidase [Microbulbifer aggregans]|uniref:2-oxoglutaramate amidase n=1 Tax=Microbulbifer aggregans TaxID=1769779 RepID=A0A1C9W5T7_9GAMM|nr:carbon-nitrogen hydrolase family protein [Microbulbifer aggregans]AOS96500.1 2-oxoglutaramate amidase [Microbulbifer aggregans]
MKDVCIAAIQMVSSESVSDNLTSAHSLLCDAVSRGVKIALLPENFAHMSDRGSFSVAETFAGEGEACPERQPIQSALQHWTAELGIWIVAGSVPLSQRPDGSATEGRRSRSACLVYDAQGKLRARYDKIHLFDVEVEDAAGSYRESASIEPGEETLVTPTPWGQLGLSVCFDLRFPELYRNLAVAGAEVLVVPSAFTHTTGQAHWLTLLRARAIENGCFVIGANQGGVHSPKRRTWGHSVIIDPWGEVLAEAGEGEAVITANLQVVKLEKVRRQMPLLSMRRL